MTTSAEILLELRESAVPQYLLDYYTEEREGYAYPDGTVLHNYAFYNVVEPFIDTNSLA